MRVDSPSLLALLYGLASAVVPAASEAQQLQAQWGPPPRKMCKFKSQSQFCTPEQCSRDANDFFLHNCPNDAMLGRGDCNAVVKRIQQMCQELPAIHKRPWYDPSSCRKGIEEVIGTVEFCRRQRQPYRCLAKRRTAGEQCQVEARDFLYWRCFVTPKEPLKLAGCISFFLILVKECEGESSGLRGICIA